MSDNVLEPSETADQAFQEVISGISEEPLENSGVTEISNESLENEEKIEEVLVDSSHTKSRKGAAQSLNENLGFHTKQCCENFKARLKFLKYS